MDIFFQDPSEIPLPPEEVRIRELRAEPWPDGRRVRIYLEVDPFQKRPSAEVSISDATGVEVAQVSVIETMNRKMEFTMHLSQPRPNGPYTVHVLLYYAVLEPEMPEQEPKPIERSVVDTAAKNFELASAEH